MRSYQRILTIVDTCHSAEPVVRRAAQLAQLYRASLALACAVDYAAGLESDHIPFMTPVEMRKAIVADVGEKLRKLADAAGAGGAELIVAEGTSREVTVDLVTSWQPDLVVVSGEVAWPGEWNAIARSLECDGQIDVLRVQMDRPGFAGRIIQALAYGF
ncbi:MAG: universal stress protein [Pseudomonadota bacterium]